MLLAMTLCGLRHAGRGRQTSSAASVVVADVKGASGRKHLCRVRRGIECPSTRDRWITARAPSAEGDRQRLVAIAPRPGSCPAAILVRTTADELAQTGGFSCITCASGCRRSEYERVA